MLENIRLSFQGIWSHKMRSFLTMLGIIIGIAAIISIVSTIKGTNEQIKNNLIGAGDNTVTVELWQGDMEAIYMDDMNMLMQVPGMDEETMQEIREIPDVEAASAYQKKNIWDGIYYNGTSFEGMALGVTEDYFSTCSYIFRVGRNFTEADSRQFKKVVIMDQDAADNLFQGESAIGKTLDIKGEPFTVIGVVEKMDKFEPVINSEEDYYDYIGYGGNSAVYIPSSTWCIPFQYDVPQNVVVKAKTTDDMTKTSQKAAKILNARIPEESEMKYKAENFLEQAKQLQELGQATNTQMLWIASISLLVGGIGVMNIMLVSVTERTREIGLKKAIGARKRKIMIQFLTEAAVLTSVGGLLGVLAGIGLAQVISKVGEIPMAISIPAIIGGVAFSTLIGIIFGLLPSFKAASLNPIDALRYE